MLVLTSLENDKQVEAEDRYVIVSSDLQQTRAASQRRIDRDATPEQSKKAPQEQRT